MFPDDLNKMPELAQETDLDKLMEALGLSAPAPSDTTVEEVEAELNPKLDAVVGTLVEAIDQGGRELAGSALAMAILAMGPGEIIDLTLMACLRLAENKVAARDAAG